MALFDPNEWWSPEGWSRAPLRRARAPRCAVEINREVARRWLAGAAFCLCFACLAPPALIPAAFAGLMGLAGLASVGLALLRREHPLEPAHLTAWDEAALFFAVSLGLGLIL
jgi:hypothetical protein